MSLQQQFDVVSATSLLSVVDEKERALKKLIALLKDSDATLIIIEPTEKMCKEHVRELMVDLRTSWYYKGLLLWASAREGKAISSSLFNALEDVEVSHRYFLHEMVRVTYIKKCHG